jgi:hypothetical protein
MSDALHHARFWTEVRGVPSDVEMKITSWEPPTFTIKFHQGGFSPLTREEIVALCREAAARNCPQ